MVNASGSNIVLECSTCSAVAPAAAKFEGHLVRIDSINDFLDWFRRSQSALSGISTIFSPESSFLPFQGASPNTCLHNSTAASDAQLLMCTPLVTWPMGTSELGHRGKRG